MFLKHLASDSPFPAALALSNILTPYLNPVDFEADNCDRQCFQNFQYATHDFFSTCRPELSSAVKIASLMSAFQQYRNQACCESRHYFYGKPAYLYR